MLEIFKLEDTQKEHLHCLYCGNKRPDFILRLRSKIAYDAFISSSICAKCLKELKAEFNQDFNYLSGLKDTEIGVSSTSSPCTFPH